MVKVEFRAMTKRVRRAGEYGDDALGKTVAHLPLPNGPIRTRTNLSL